MKCTNKEQETCQVEKRGCGGCFYEEKYGEKTADEMFEELGYNKKQVTDEFIVYSKKELKYKSQKEWEICIDFNCYDKYLMLKNKSYFCLEELQAINKKVEEMGWI